MERIVDDGYRDYEHWPEGALTPASCIPKNADGRQKGSIDAHVILTL